jgi:hypothetical protein
MHVIIDATKSVSQVVRVVNQEPTCLIGELPKTTAWIKL